MPYRVAKDAERDLDEIFLYWTKQAGLTVADRLIDNITDRFWLLGEYPEAGRPADEAGTGVKCFPAGKYLIYYRKTRRGTEARISSTSFTARGIRSGPSKRHPELKRLRHMARAVLHLRQVDKKLFRQIRGEIGAHVNRVLILVYVYGVPKAQQVHLAGVRA
jgi:toxin ParE1/3/4